MTGELFFVCVIPWEVAVKQIVFWRFLANFGYRTWNGLILRISRISRGISHSTYIRPRHPPVKRITTFLISKVARYRMIHVEGLVWWFVWERKTLNTKNNRNSAWSTPVFTSFPSLQMLLAIGTSKAFCSPEESPHLSCGKKKQISVMWSSSVWHAGGHVCSLWGTVGRLEAP